MNNRDDSLHSLSYTHMDTYIVNALTNAHSLIQLTHASLERDKKRLNNASLPTQAPKPQQSARNHIYTPSQPPKYKH